MQEEDEYSSIPKGKKCFTRSEILTKLKSNESDVQRVVSEMIEELCPFDVNDEDALAIEDRLERLEKVSRNLQTKVYKLKSKLKDRKFRHKPEFLEETEVSSSQYSLFESQEYQDFSEEKDYVPPKSYAGKYNKKPLNQDLTKFSRRRRVMTKRDTLKEWALEEGVSVTELLGYFLHLENYTDSRKVASVGWKLFIGEDNISEKPKLSLEEAIWLREKAGMSEAVYQEVRLRLLDRIFIPPTNIVREENKKHRPELVEYRH